MKSLPLTLTPQKRFGIAIAIMTQLPFSAALAGIYKNPDTRLAIGANFDPLYPNEGRVNCFDFEKDVSLGRNHSATETVWSIDRVESQQDLFNKLDVTASLSGGSLFFSGKTSVDFSTTDSFHSDSLTWALVGRSTFDHGRANNLRLKPELQGYSLDQIKQRCGTEVVDHVKLRVEFAAVFTLKNISRAHRESLKWDLDFHGNIGPGSLEFKSSLNKILNSASSTSSFTGKFFFFGGNGISKVADLSESLHFDWTNPAVSFGKMNSLINQYVRELNYSAAIPFEFRTIPIDRIVGYPTDSAKIASDIVDSSVTRLYFAHEHLKNTIHRLDLVISGGRREFGLQEWQVRQYQDLLNKHQQIQNRIVSGAKGYLQGLRSLHDSQYCQSWAGWAWQQVCSVGSGFTNSNWQQMILDEIHQLGVVDWPERVVEEPGKPWKQYERPVKELYREILQREFDPAGLEHFCKIMERQKGQDSQVRSEMANSDEAFVLGCFREILNRCPGDERPNYWEREMPRLGRTGVRNGIAESNEAFVQHCYRKYLGRWAETEGLNYWCNALNGLSRDCVENSIGDSLEARNRR